ncbi:MAG: thiamine ABC transporter substrate-binding protein [Anaerolineales bacterium]
MKRFFSFLLLLTFLLAACAPQATATPPAEPATLIVMTHDSFAVSDSVIQAFEQANQVKVSFIKSGDAGAALNKAILTKDAPLADVFFGVDNTFLSRALDSGIFEAYDAPALAKIPAEFQLDSQKRALPADFGDVCINYDKAWFAAKGLTPPTSLDDLTRPEYKDLLVVENPATSSPGLAFLLATIARYGENGYLDYWKDLRANGVTVVDGWDTAYYTNFSASSGKGPQPMVVSYASSPAAEVIFASAPLSDAPTASLLDGCFRQIEFIGILKGTQNRALAEKFVDFVLDTPFQQDMPGQMFVYPVNPAAPLPEAFAKYAQIAPAPLTLPAETIAARRDAWIEAFTQAVLR